MNPTGNQVDNRNELSLKIDFQLDDKDKISATMGGNRNPTSDDFRFADVPGFPVVYRFQQYFLNVAYTRNWSNALLNEFRVTAQRTNNQQAFPVRSNSSPGDVGVAIHSDDPTGVPIIQFDNGFLAGNSPYGPTTFANDTFYYSDTLSWIKGKHSWKFGAGFSPYENNTSYDYYVNGEFYFAGSGIGADNTLANFLLGIPAQFFQYPKAPSNIRSKNTFSFAQDEWHVNRRLVLNLGVRYEYSTPKSDTLGRSYSIIPGQQSTVFPGAPNSLVFPGDKGVPTGSNFPDKNDFAPRVGFAYDVKGDGRTSIRGGIGVFYDILKGEDNLQFNGQPPFFSSAGIAFNPPAGGATSNFTYLSDPFGTAGVTNPFPSRPVDHSIDFGAAGLLPFNSGGAAFFVDPHLRTPYVLQYNLSVEREVTKDTVLDLTYVGSDAHKLTSLVDVNPFDVPAKSGIRLLNELPANQACNAAFGYCFASMPEFRNVANQVYSGFEAGLTRRPTRTWELGDTYFTIGYTYAHNIDNASGFRQSSSTVPYYNPSEFRASSDQDVRHRVTISGGWDLALDHWWERGWKRATQGWSLFPYPYVEDRFSLQYPCIVLRPIRSVCTGTFRRGRPGTCLRERRRIDRSSQSSHLLPVTRARCTLDQSQFILGRVRIWWCGSDLRPGTNQLWIPYGNLGRNSLRAPDNVNLDLEVAKTTKLTERVSMQLRAEMFNVLNHAEFRLPDNNAYSGTFGQIVNTYDPRIIQLAVRFKF